MRSPIHQQRFQAGWRKYLFSVLIGLAAFGSGILLDVTLGVENRGILYSDIFTGVVAAFLSLMLARYYERLRSRIQSACGWRPTSTITFAMH